VSDLSSDSLLFSQLQSNDSQSLGALFNKYYQSLCRFTYLIVHEKSVAEELSANVFINLWENRGQTFIHTSLKAYLYKSARNQAISYLRKKKGIIYSLENDHDFANQNDLGPESIFIDDELKTEFDKALHKLTPKARLAFSLHRFEGMKYTDIAEIMEISVSAVEKNIASALKSLYKELFRQTMVD